MTGVQTCALPISGFRQSGAYHEHQGDYYDARVGKRRERLFGFHYPRYYEDDKRAASEAGMQRLLKQDKNIYFLNPGMPLGDDHDATVDGVHPSDLGHGRILEVIRPQIVKILKKHDIR